MDLALLEAIRLWAWPEKVNARPGEDRAFEQFLSESFMVGETTWDDRGRCDLDHCMDVNWLLASGIQGRTR